MNSYQFVLLLICASLISCGLLKKKRNETPAAVTSMWHYYDRFMSHEDCVKNCPVKLIEEKRDYDGTPDSYMCMFSVSKVWYAMGVSRAFNCYYKNTVGKAYPGMSYVENDKYFGFEDGAYYNQEKCQDECKETCWNEIDTNYYYCVWTSDANYN